MPNNDYNYGASFIMGSDKTSYDAADAPLTREGKDFDTTMGNYDLKKQSKPTVEASLFKMAEEKDY